MVISESINALFSSSWNEKAIIMHVHVSAMTSVFIFTVVVNMVIWKNTDIHLM